MTLHQQFLIALGGNLPSKVGDPRVTLNAALQHLEGAGVAIEEVSAFFHTPCFPAGAGPDFVNAAACVGWPDGAMALLQVLHETEAEFGRDRVSRWAGRTLDLDLIAAGDRVHPDLETFLTWHDLALEKQMEKAPDQLILPHPRLQDRAFVLVPLADIAPQWRHPVLNRTVAQMLDALPNKDKSEVRPV